MSIEIVSESEGRTQVIAVALARRLRGGDVLALRGPLGAGKTCFVRGLALGLGLSPAEVSSPTFVICQEYQDVSRPLTLVHVDAYRLSGPEDLAAIGWEELLEADAVVIAVEWPEIIEAALPADRIEVALAHVGPTVRRITIAAHGVAQARLADLERALQELERASSCPTCGQSVGRDEPMYPFCSSRCRMADLGRWFSETYRITRPVRSDDLE